MPELPEVEIVCRTLAELMAPGEKLLSWHFFRKDLRYPIPRAALKRLEGRALTGIRRRAKYILLDFGDLTLISHLGMTGSWRLEKAGWPRRKHDHLAFEMAGSRFFVFEDARRFGFVEVVTASKMAERFSELGLEPLEEEADFTALTRTFRQLKSPIKSAIMNQKLLVGVGNIYASEILFRVGVHPLKKCSQVSLGKYVEIWRETVRTLRRAIRRGGSTIENYRNARGESGNFQREFFVYGREGEACRKCHTGIRAEMLAGRSTYWCPSCQKRN